MYAIIPHDIITTVCLVDLHLCFIQTKPYMDEIEWSGLKGFGTFEVFGHVMNPQSL